MIPSNGLSTAALVLCLQGGSVVFNILIDKRISCILYLQVGGVGTVRLCGWSGDCEVVWWSGD